MIRHLVLALIAACNGALAAPPDAMQYGRSYLAEGEYAAAAKSFAEMLRLNPADPAALNNMGVAKAAAGDYQAAVELLTRAQKLAPQRSDIQENLINLLDWSRTYGNATPASEPAPDALAQQPPALWPAPPRQAAGASRSR